MAAESVASRNRKISSAWKTKCAGGDCEWHLKFSWSLLSDFWNSQGDRWVTFEILTVTAEWHLKFSRWPLSDIWTSHGGDYEHCFLFNDAVSNSEMCLLLWLLNDALDKIWKKNGGNGLNEKLIRSLPGETEEKTVSAGDSTKSQTWYLQNTNILLPLREVLHPQLWHRVFWHLFTLISESSAWRRQLPSKRY
jgi:hypothetical protein